MKDVKINGIFLSDGIQNKITTAGKLSDEELVFNLLGIDTKIDLVNKIIYRNNEDQQIKIDIQKSKIYINIKDIDNSLIIPINVKTFFIKDKALKFDYNIENTEENFVLEIEFKII